MWPLNTDKSESDSFSLEKARSQVRISVTYMAALFLFGGGTLFILFLLYKKRTSDAIDLFNIILPVTTTIIAFWFGTRGVSKDEQRGPNSQEKKKDGDGDPVEIPEL